MQLVMTMLHVHVRKRPNIENDELYLCDIIFQLLSRRALYKPNFQALVKHIRAFSSHSGGPVAGSSTVYDETASGQYS